MKRTKKEALETRANILESAFDILSVKNFANTSVTEISNRAGLTKGAFYWHFRNKSDLLLQLVESICQDNEESFRNILGTPRLSGELWGYYKKELAKLEENARYAKIHMMMARRQYEWPAEVQEKARQIIVDYFERDRLAVERFVVLGQKEGRFKKDIPTGDIAVLISSIFHGLYMMQLAGNLPKSFSEHTDILFDTFNKILTADENAVLLRN